MGYTTIFQGQFTLNKKLTNYLFNFLNDFSETRHVKRNVDSEYGYLGEFYLDPKAEHDDLIDGYNDPHPAQPGFWCKWVPTEDKMGIKWNGIEKFYNYVEWLSYLIENFLAPRGYVLNGEIRFQGEDPKDNGKIRVSNNYIDLCDCSKLSPINVFEYLN